MHPCTIRPCTSHIKLWPYVWMPWQRTECWSETSSCFMNATLSQPLTTAVIAASPSYQQRVLLSRCILYIFYLNLNQQQQHHIINVQHNVRVFNTRQIFESKLKRRKARERERTSEKDILKLKSKSKRMLFIRKV